MAESVNVKRKGVDSIITYQMRDQIWSLTVTEKPDLIDLEMSPGNDVTITPHSDYRKENVIDVSVTGGGGISANIVHGTNDTTEHSKLTIDTTSLQAMLTSLGNRIAALEGN